MRFLFVNIIKSLLGRDMLLLLLLSTYNMGILELQSILSQDCLHLIMRSF